MANIQVSVNEFLSECNSWEIKAITTALKQDGHITSDLCDDTVTGAGYDENLYERSLKALKGKWNQISREEEETILKIAKRFI